MKSVNIRVPPPPVELPLIVRVWLWRPTNVGVKRLSWLKACEETLISNCRERQCFIVQVTTASRWIVQCTPATRKKAVSIPFYTFRNNFCWLVFQEQIFFLDQSDCYRLNWNQWQTDFSKSITYSKEWIYSSIMVSSKLGQFLFNCYNTLSEKVVV